MGSPPKVPIQASSGISELRAPARAWVLRHGQARSHSHTSRRQRTRTRCPAVGQLALVLVLTQSSPLALLSVRDVALGLLTPMLALAPTLVLVLVLDLPDHCKHHGPWEWSALQEWADEVRACHIGCETARRHDQMGGRRDVLRRPILLQTWLAIAEKAKARHHEQTRSLALYP